MVRPRKKKDDVIVVKKYANRRLYDTGRSSYVTLDDLCEMIKEGQEFVVQDAKSGEDLTQQVLTQIIVEQESRGQSMLPPNFLRTLIKFYGDGMQGLVPNYLEQALQNFVQHQETLRQSVSKSFTGMMPGMSMMPGSQAFEELNRKNIEMFSQTMNMFSPFRAFGPQGAQPAAPGKPAGAQTGPAKAPSREDRVRQLKADITKMQEELRGLIQ
ncbi:MAG: polyhydroxyalkanoate synthesis repressor PhaR [Rhodospirillales bacterium]|nr:polyhydroxyalkanoate synthesis repressor PhaR [Rhodospirillales bacterium]USO07317.1 MAG: polyhydroxyalkanoate synthesis repressor PhaR [Rhodospirillales bacterium]